jgi:hypothetical protein
MKKLINFIKCLFKSCKHDCRESLVGTAQVLPDVPTKKTRTKQS